MEEILVSRTVVIDRKTGIKEVSDKYAELNLENVDFEKLFRILFQSSPQDYVDEFVLSEQKKRWKEQMPCLELDN